MEIGNLGHDRSRCCSEKNIALSRTTGAAQMGHAEPFDPGMDVVISEAVILGIGTELNHSERNCGSGEKIDTVIGIATGTDEGIHARGGAGWRGGLSISRVNT